MAQIIPFPKQPRRIPVGPHFTVEEPETHQDVRERFAEEVQALRWLDKLPGWLIGPVHLEDEDRSGR